MSNRIFIPCAIVLLVCVLPLGCSQHRGVLGHDCCADIPAGAIPAPAGSKICDWQTEQVTAAAADQTVLYQADFVDRSATLSPAALKRLSRQAQTDLAVARAWVIEPSGQATLDTARVEAVSRELAIRGVESPLIQIAIPAALGLTGPQAERVAGSLGSARNSNSGSNAPISRPSGFGNGFAGGLR
ncbi:MAG: hypothetical protein VYA84_21425 [Planctomycetota bacterium]|nr:hypothetical protein [Planctomycetota bacterium]